MTTKNSPLSALKKQADAIARMIKAFERGETVPVPYIEKLEAARANKSSVKFGIAMDDRIISITIAWADIAATGEVVLAKRILELMRAGRDTLH